MGVSPHAWDLDVQYEKGERVLAGGKRQPGRVGFQIRWPGRAHTYLRLLDSLRQYRERLMWMVFQQTWPR